ncbi:hypothetical protein PAHAL_9G635400 [Panicum hallii]|uniref:Uncharacterized protein n=1 Tax=Panicum hallii TaxID=206008 RepID=A0A2T8I6Q8_9POAL|nr:hypothetical protein PAHAL_9G635400 [Panicum hallii]
MHCTLYSDGQTNASLFRTSDSIGLCHGRRIPSAEAVMAHDVEAPPGEGFSNKHKQQGPRWRRVQDLSESKRKVPQGPNPLHN